MAAVRARTESRAAELLLPLATGLLIVGINAALPLSGGALLGLMVMLTLGAVLRGHPWRTGAIVAAPIVMAAVARAAGDSLGASALFVVAAPILVAILAAAVKGGAMLAAPASEPKAADGRWRPFETQAQRGRFLVIVAVLLVIGTSYCRNLGAGEADRAAARRVEEIRGALAGQTAASLHQARRLGFTGRDTVPGGPYRTTRAGSDRFAATAEVRRYSQFRCIHVEVDAAGAITTRVTKDRCD
jgi:hypothetical protein